MADNATVKLAAVNDVLRRIGKLPGAQLDTGGGSTVALVEAALDDAIESILAKGWYFNRKFDEKITSDGSNEMPLTLLGTDTAHTTVYHVDSYGGDSYRNITVRDSKLYDLDDNTTTMPASMLVEYWYRVDLADVPQNFLKWIIAVAAFNFNRAYIGNQGRDGQLQAEMVAQEAAARREEFEASDTNVLETSEAMQLRGRPRMKNRSVYD